MKPIILNADAIDSTPVFVLIEKIDLPILRETIVGKNTHLIYIVDGDIKAIAKEVKRDIEESGDYDLDTAKIITVNIMDDQTDKIKNIIPIHDNIVLYW